MYQKSVMKTKTKDSWLGIDCGSVSLKFALVDENGEVLATLYMRQRGVIKSLKEGLGQFESLIPRDVEIKGVGVTGAARKLLSVLVNADLIRTEILAHAVGCMQYIPQIKTIFEIGGEDSKILTLKDGIITDFAMNNICSGGTGAYLDELSQRLDVPIEEFGKIALKSGNQVNIAGRCSVFSRTDAIHKLNSGYLLEDVLMGVCRGLVRNYLAMLSRGKKLNPPFSFQGGAAKNPALKKAFEEQIGHEVVVPPQPENLGAIGIAFLTKDYLGDKESNFKGFGIIDRDYQTESFVCQGCDNHCEVVQVLEDGKVIGSLGSRCGKYK